MAMCRKTFAALASAAIGRVARRRDLGRDEARPSRSRLRQLFFAAAVTFAAGVANAATTHYMPNADIVYSGDFIPAGGVLVFPGKTLADLEGCHFWGRIAGNYVGRTGTALSQEPLAYPAGATGAAIERYDFDLQQLEGSDLKAVHVQLENGEGGVWAKCVRAWNKGSPAETFASERHFTVDADGNLSWSDGAGATLATGFSANGYGICELGVARPVSKAASSLAFAGTTVAAIAKNYSGKIAVRMCGMGTTSSAASYWGVKAVVTNMAVIAGTAEAPTAIRFEAQLLNGAASGNLACAVFTLSDGAGGVYAQQTGAYYTPYDAATATYGFQFVDAGGNPASGVITYDASAEGLACPDVGIYNIEIADAAPVAHCGWLWDCDTYLFSNADTLVFPGATLADLASCEFYGSMDGAWVEHGGNFKTINSGSSKTVRYPSDAADEDIQKLFVTLTYPGNTTRAVLVEMTQGDDGVRARAVKATYKDENSARATPFTVNASGVVGLVSGWSNTNVSNADNARGYGIRRFGATKALGSSPVLVFPGKKVADVFRGEISAKECGAWMSGHIYEDFTVLNRVVTSRDAETDAITGFRCEVHFCDGVADKGLAIHFTDGEGGVYAKANLACYIEGVADFFGTYGRKFVSDNGSSVTGGYNTGTHATTLWASGYGVCGLAAALPDDASTGPATAEWNGGDPALAASWTCKAGDGRVLAGALPDKYTHVLLPTGTTTMTADADLRPYASVMTAASGLTVNTAGHKLYVSTLEPWLACTVTDSVGGGELHVDLAEGMQSYNTQVALSGKLKFVKDGKGCFVPVKRAQAYTGGNVIAAGYLRLGETVTSSSGGGTVYQHGLGGNGSTAVTSEIVQIDEGAVFDIYGNKWLGYMTVNLNGGTLYGASVGANTPKNLMADSYLTLNGDMTIDSSTVFNGYTLNVAIPSSKHLYLKGSYAGPGTINLLSGGWFSVTSGNLDMSNVDLVANAALEITKTLSVHDYRAKYGEDNNTLTGALNVYGTFTPECGYFAGATMQNGSAIDLSEQTLPWSAQSAFTSGNQLKIAAGADIRLVLPELVFPDDVVTSGREIVIVTNLNENVDFDVSRITCVLAGARTESGRTLDGITLKSSGTGISAVLPRGFTIRIAESAESFSVPYSWIYGNGLAGAEDSDEDIKAALEEKGANGIPVWQSYFLGLDHGDPGSVVLCEAADSQPAPGTVAIVAKNLAVPAGLEGVTVTAYLDRKSGSGGWENGIARASVPPSSGGTATLAGAMEAGATLNYFRIRVGLAGTAD